MTATVIQLKTKPQKTTRTRVDTISFTQADVASWKRPEFQRDITHTQRMGEVIKYIQENHGVLPGVLTLGVLDGTGEVYKIDCHHRCEAFKESGLETGYADVRYLFGSMEDFAAEYGRLNQQISTTKPDDRLRAAAVSNPKIGRLKSRCKVIGYAPKRNQEKIQIPMSSVLRAWLNATSDVPAARGKAASAVEIISAMSDTELEALIRLINLCESAWGRDRAYAQLWGQLNLTLVMWIYIRMVLNKPDSARLKQLSAPLFEKCLMSLSANAKHVEWLKGRNGTVHRSPCYVRIKEIFQSRLREETGTRSNLPQPDWAANSSK